ncbi:MAG: hypothetical protein ACI8UO_000102 [Verrucomicrobiales bacterium]|jgi:hypothetical protein
MAENPYEPPETDLGNPSSSTADNEPVMNAVELGESFRQTRREMFVMLGGWLVFFLWTGICGWLFSQFKAGEEVPLLFGMPKWAFIGVVLPWIAANVFIFWFAGRFMKDTNLGPGSEEQDV